MSKKYRWKELGEGRKALMKEWAIVERLSEMKMVQDKIKNLTISREIVKWRG